MNICSSLQSQRLQFIAYEMKYIVDDFVYSISVDDFVTAMYWEGIADQQYQNDIIRNIKIAPFSCDSHNIICMQYCKEVYQNIFRHICGKYLS